MNQQIKRYVSVVLLVAASHLCYGQYLDRLYDYDSTYDWGFNLFIKSDSSYFIMGVAQRQYSGIMNITVSHDGSTVYNKHLATTDSAGMFLGSPGEAKMLASGGYISPVTVQLFRGTYGRSWTGLVKYDALGNTIFLKTYTDTSVYFEAMHSCAVMPAGGYLLGGFRDLNAGSYYPALLIRTDSLGDTLWTRTYKRMGGTTTKILNIIPLADGRIVVGAISTYMADAGGIHHLTYAHNSPWFMVLDSMGNILKDTIYSDPYLVGWNICGSLYPDKNGGYIHIGAYDSLSTAFPDNIQNFPTYIAHLDTNFRITWITEFGYSEYNGRRGGVNVHQLQDGNFVVKGDVGINMGCGTFGWAAKVDKDGKILWSHNYYSESMKFAYLRDMVEKPDGSLVFVGKTFNDTLPTWRANGDVWLIGVDSNGCLLPGGCDPDTMGGVTATSPQFSPQVERGLLVWPNPNEGSFTIRVSSVVNEQVHIVITNMVGEKIKELTAVTNKDTELLLNAAPGLYLLSATTNNSRYVVKMVIAQ